MSLTPSLRLQLHPGIPAATRWDMPKVISAIERHERGDFYSSSLLVTHFGRDDKITGATEDRLNALTGPGSRSFGFTDSEEAKEREEDDPLIPELEAWWYEALPDSWARQTLHDTIHQGFSLSYVEWELTTRTWQPKKLHHWHPSAVYYDDQHHCYVARTTQGDVRISKEDPNWFLHEPRGDRSWMSGAVRSLGPLYLARNWDFRDWARYNQRHGQPIITIKEPTGQDESGSKDTFFQGIKTMGSSGVLRLPQGDDGRGFEVDLMEASARTYDSFDKFLGRINTAIAVRITGQNLSSEISGGSYAASASHMRVRNDVVVGDASSLADSLRSQILIPWGTYNVPGFSKAMAPWPAWNLDIPEDLAALATSQSSAVGTLNTLLAMKDNEGKPIPVDVEAYLKRFNIPLVG
jgi:phage gp29-like protein